MKCGTKKMAKGGKATHKMEDGSTMKGAKHSYAKGGGVKTRGCGAATKGKMARGPMA